MKIAFVKQEVYQDLYVCSNDCSNLEKLLSSQGRVGPLGLFTIYGADFYIVKEENARECKIWTKVIPNTEKKFSQLKYKTLDKIEGQEFKRPGSDKPNGYYAISVNDIEWSKYDIVISINCSIPTNIVIKYTNVLWAYMIGEANIMNDDVYFGYDVVLNQEITGYLGGNRKVIDFPYTFIGPNCLYDLIKSMLNRESNNEGVYAEINSFRERPVKNIGHFKPVKDSTKHEIKLHKQLIKDNLIEIFDSKYYVKLGGRMTRGNGALEAISLSTLVLMSPEDIICTQILPKDCWIYSDKDVIEKIKYLDENPDEYNRLLNMQKQLLKQFVLDYPMESLIRALLEKRKLNKPNKIKNYSILRYYKQLLKKFINKLHNK